MSVQQCSGINRTGERRGERCGQTKRVSHPYFCARHAEQQHPLRESETGSNRHDHYAQSDEGYLSDSSMRGNYDRIDANGRRVRYGTPPDPISRSSSGGTPPDPISRSSSAGTSAQQQFSPMDLGANAAAINTLLGLMQHNLNLNLRQSEPEPEQSKSDSGSQTEPKPLEIRAPETPSPPFVSYVMEDQHIDNFMKKQREQHLVQEINMLKTRQRDRQRVLMKLLEDVKETFHNAMASIHHLKNAIEEGEM